MALKQRQLVAESKEHRGQKMLYALCSMLYATGPGLLVLYSVLCVFLIWGCVSLPREGDILAIVDGEPVSEEDLKYSLQIAHRREDLSSSTVLDLSLHVQKLIDDKLIAQEAHRMEMEQYPDVQQAIAAYILRESVVRLHDEEILQKVSVTENDIISDFRNKYERLTLEIIEADSEQVIRDVLKQLKSGGNFTELASKYSTHYSREEGGRVVYKRKSIVPHLQEAVFSLKPGEFSDIIKNGDQYYIVKLISRQEAPDEELENIREAIESALRSQKRKELGDRYLDRLRERADIKVNHELLSAIVVDKGTEERKKWADDKRTLADVNGSILTVKEFVEMVPAIVSNSNQEILNHWIDRKLVDLEALSRHYDETSDLKNMVSRYTDYLLKKAFIRRVILPDIEISDEVLKDYYLKNPASFLKPARYRIQQITVKTMDDAEDILSDLKNGADFSWLAKTKSTDSAAPKGGFLGWLTREQLPEPLRDKIDAFSPGDISPIEKIDSLYRIFRFQEKTEEEVEEFDQIKSIVYRAYVSGQINDRYGKYVEQLKEEAEIKINEDKIKLYEKKLIK